MARLKADKAAQDERLERQLWTSADKLRKKIDAAECERVVLGLFFLRSISDSFADRQGKAVRRAERRAAPKPARIRAGDRPTYPSGEGLS